MHSSSIKMLQAGCVTENGTIQDLNVTTVDSVMIKVSKSLERISHLLLICLNIIGICFCCCYIFFFFCEDSFQ